MKPRNEKHEPMPRLPIVGLSGLALALAALALPLSPLVADPPTGTWHVAVTTAPHLPQDVWFAGKGNNTDGWTSGGSICLNHLAQGIEGGEQVTFQLDVIEGGIVGEDGMPVPVGTYTFPGIEQPAVDYDVTAGTSFYVIMEGYVVQSKLAAFPKGATFTFMFMWDFAPGREDVHAVLWLDTPFGFVPFLNEGTLMANVRFFGP